MLPSPNCNCRVRDDTLVDLGIRLEDKPDGSSVWKPEDPAVLRQEQVCGWQLACMVWKPARVNCMGSSSG